MSDVDMFESDDRTELVLQTSCSSESESDTECYRGCRSLDMSVLFGANKRKLYTQLVLLVLLLVVVMEVLVNSVNLGERALVLRVQVLQLVMANALKRTMWSVRQPPAFSATRPRRP